MMPAWSNAPLTTPYEPPREPVCDTACLAPLALLPFLNTTMGLLRSLITLFAVFMNLRPSPRPSTYRPMTLVCGSSDRYHIMSASSTSDLLPYEIILLMPNESELSMNAMPTVPLCDRNATSPFLGRTILACPWNAQSRRFAPLNIPMQLGPIILILSCFDSSFTCASIAARSPPSSLPPPEITTKLWMPFFEAALSRSGTNFRSTVTTAMSTLSGMSSRLLYALMPIISG